MRNQWLRLLVFVSVLMAWTPPAYADQDAQADVEAQKQQARWLMKKGEIEYDIGRFDKAIELYQRAYDAFPYVEAIFNLGQAHRQSKNYRQAIFFYQSYLRNRPDARNEAFVRSLIEKLEALVAEQRAAEKRPPVGLSQPREMDEDKPVSAKKEMKVGQAEQMLADPWYADTMGWIATGVGVLGLAGAGVLQMQALSRHEDAKAALDPSVAASLQASARSKQRMGLIVGGVGLAALTAGAIFLAVHDSPKEPALRATVSLAPDGAGLVLMGRF